MRNNIQRSEKIDMYKIFFLLIIIVITLPGYCQNNAEHLLLDQGDSKCHLQDYSGAILSYSKAIEINPKYVDSYIKRGFVKFVYLKDYTGAISDFTKAISINPFCIEAYNYRGVVKSEVKDDQGAIEDFTKAIELDNNANNSSEYYFNRATSKTRLQDYLGAILDYNIIIENNPKWTECYISRGNNKRELKDYRGAISDYNKAIVIEPKNASAYFYRGYAKYYLNDFKGAIIDYTISIKFEPKNAATYYNRGLAKFKLKQKNNGCIDMSKAGELGYEKAYEAIREYCQ